MELVWPHTSLQRLLPWILPFPVCIGHSTHQEMGLISQLLEPWLALWLTLTNKMWWKPCSELQRPEDLAASSFSLLEARSHVRNLTTLKLSCYGEAIFEACQSARHVTEAFLGCPEGYQLSEWSQLMPHRKQESPIQALPKFLIHRTIKIINQCGSKPLHFRVICYTIICNWNRHYQVHYISKL